MANGTCTINGCNGKRLARGWCKHHYKRWHRYGTTDGPADPICATCGKTFPRPHMDGPAPAYCGASCDPRLVRRSARQPWSPCSVCGTPTEGFGSFRTYCSPRCQSERQSHPNGRPQRNCLQCGVPLDFTQVRPGGRRLRSDTLKCFTCRRDQRCLLTVAELAVRDGETCSLCRQPVDMSLVWPDRFAPTRDHVMPYSLGGGNGPENLALAHFTCNVSKKNRVTAATSA